MSKLWKWLLRWLMDALRWFEDRTGFGRLIGPILRYPIPPGAASLRRGWWYVFGVATLTAFIIEVVTGAALVTMYIPSTANAYDSLLYISETATLGRLLRGMHYFGASAMVILVVLHMARVFLTGSFKFPREMSWVTGVILLGLTLALAFTGGLLRWDQDAIGSVLIAVEQTGRVPLIGDPLARFLLAGDTISGTTLSRFFALHVFILPALIVAVIGFHLYLVAHHGVSEPPQTGRPVNRATYRAWYARLLRKHGRPYWPDVAWRDALVGVGMLVVIAALAIVFGARTLAEPPDPTITEAEPRPDWYFLWYQAFLEAIPDSLGEYVMILFPPAIGAALVLLPFLANRGERSPARRPWAVGAVALGAITVVAFLYTGYLAPYVPDFETEPLPPQVVGADSGQVLEGSRLFYAKGCQYCHAIEGRGGRYGPDLTHVLRRYPEERLAIIILRGRDEMPAYRGSLTEEELAAILAFLRAMNER